MKSQNSAHDPPLIVCERRPASDVGPNRVNEDAPLRPFQRAGGRHELVMHVVRNAEGEPSVLADLLPEPKPSPRAATFPVCLARCHANSLPLTALVQFDSRNVSAYIIGRT
jgi:hypothetical protein